MSTSNDFSSDIKSVFNKSSTYGPEALIKHFALNMFCFPSIESVVVIDHNPMLGADIGTSVAVLIASQKFTTLAPFLLAVGIFGFISSKENKRQNVFRAIGGLGLILLALILIKRPN